jgi:hypothetical protein
MSSRAGHQARVSETKVPGDLNIKLDIRASPPESYLIALRRRTTKRKISLAPGYTENSFAKVLTPIATNFEKSKFSFISEAPRLCRLCETNPQLLGAG